MEEEYQADVIDEMDDARASKLLGNMDPDDAADIVRDLPYEKAERLLRLMGVESAEGIRQLLGYREDTAGAMMTTRFVACHDDDTVSEAIETLRQAPDDFPSIHYLYVLNQYNKLTGVLSLRTLVLANPTDLLRDVMYDDDLITVLPEEDEEEVADIISKYNLASLPVVDEHGKMLGIVTFDDAFDVIEDEYEEGKAFSKMFRSALLISGFTAFMVFYTLLVLKLAGVGFGA